MKVLIVVTVVMASTATVTISVGKAGVALKSGLQRSQPTIPGRRRGRHDSVRLLSPHARFLLTVGIYQVECPQEGAPFCSDSLAPVTSHPLLSGLGFLLCQLLLKETRLSEVFF